MSVEERLRPAFLAVGGCGRFDLRGMRTSLFEGVAGLARCLVVRRDGGFQSGTERFARAGAQRPVSYCDEGRVGRGLQVACLLAGDWYGCAGGGSEKELGLRERVRELGHGMACAT